MARTSRSSVAIGRESTSSRTSSATYTRAEPADETVAVQTDLVTVSAEAVRSSKTEGSITVRIIPTPNHKTNHDSRS